LYDVESGHISIKNCDKGTYEYLTASSSGGFHVAGTIIQWQDCLGTDPRWNDTTTDISFSDPVATCGVYRLELYDWGGNIWSLFANCDGSADPGFWIFDNLDDARASLVMYPELSISNLMVTGICPDYTVGADISNAGCKTADVTVCVETTLGGHWEFMLPAVAPGDTKTGSCAIVAPACSAPFTINATVDCHDDVIECSEGGGSIIPCIAPGTDDHAVHIDISPGVTPTPTTFIKVEATPNYTILLLAFVLILLAYTLKFRRSNIS